MARILVVDDDDLLREVLVRALTAAGHEVTHAADGRQAMAVFRAQPSDVVLTDIIMPEQDGTGLVMALHKEWPELPVIAMSGGAAQSGFYLDIAKRLGAQAILAKPFTVNALLRTIEQVL